MVNKSHVYVHFIPGKEAQIEGKPWIIHSAAGCHKVGRVEFESVDGMTTAETAPVIDTAPSVCSCGVSNHHLAMHGMVRVETRKVPDVGRRVVGVIRRCRDEEGQEEGADPMVNTRCFRERISALEKELKDSNKDTKYHMQRAERLDQALNKVQAKLSQTRKDIEANVDQYSQMEDTIAMLTEKNQAKNKELNALQEALKILRNKRDDSQEVADKYHKEREEKLVIKRQYDAMRRDYARQRKSSSKTKEELEGTIRKLASTIEVCTACSAVWNGFVRQESVQDMAILAGPDSDDQVVDKEATEHSDCPHVHCSTECESPMRTSMNSRSENHSIHLLCVSREGPDSSSDHLNNETAAVSSLRRVATDHAQQEVCEGGSLVLPEACGMVMNGDVSESENTLMSGSSGQVPQHQKVVCPSRSFSTSRAQTPELLLLGRGAQRTSYHSFVSRWPDDQVVTSSLPTITPQQKALMLRAKAQVPVLHKARSQFQEQVWYETNSEVGQKELLSLPGGRQLPPGGMKGSSGKVYRAPAVCRLAPFKQPIKHKVFTTAGNKRGGAGATYRE
mmetsp:Transcript_27624/g.52265  ORF Transcript_27624/g.52265 Transcript_27624/m.52265 type:complete len:562 (+) Transcript_27624:452-2137(+)